MYQGRVWIVAEEKASSDLGESVECQLFHEVTCVSPRCWRRGEVPMGLPDLLLFDLRQPDALNQAAEWASHVRGTGLVTIPWLGVTQTGIPLECAIQADQLFAGFVSFPLDATAFERAVRLARKRMVV